ANQPPAGSFVFHAEVLEPAGVEKVENGGVAALLHLQRVKRTLFPEDRCYVLAREELLCAGEHFRLVALDVYFQDEPAPAQLRALRQYTVERGHVDVESAHAVLAGLRPDVVAHARDADPHAHRTFRVADRVLDELDVGLKSISFDPFAESR